MSFSNNVLGNSFSNHTIFFLPQERRAFTRELLAQVSPAIDNLCRKAHIKAQTLASIIGTNLLDAEISKEDLKERITILVNSEVKVKFKNLDEMIDMLTLGVANCAIKTVEVSDDHRYKLDPHLELYDPSSSDASESDYEKEI